MNDFEFIESEIFEKEFSIFQFASLTPILTPRLTGFLLGAFDIAAGLSLVRLADAPARGRVNQPVADALARAGLHGVLSARGGTGRPIAPAGPLARHIPPG